ncbi:uncharacterized protein LOC113229587 isoform X4 [Hyposmocoma kahamanoa]|uniref:uncharacterized protein LOC113229587 isoform X4 n=1 Tax=Hyposmocoma kahamanoa TaxID=1477025 RepID=UPI000E6D969E|nr:uncharacterized protein LOC113229587 isoform X4 [Hyposmocoma kahamanoa]
MLVCRGPPYKDSIASRLRLEARSKSQSPSKIPVRPGAHRACSENRSLSPRPRSVQRDNSLDCVDILSKTRSKTLSFLHPYNNNADIISDTSSRRTSYKGTSDNTSKCSTLTVIENGYGSPLVLPIHRRLTLRREGGKVGSNAVSVSNAKQSLVNVKAPPILLKPRGKTS